MLSERRTACAWCYFREACEMTMLSERGALSSSKIGTSVRPVGIFPWNPERVLHEQDVVIAKGAEAQQQLDYACARVLANR